MRLVKVKFKKSILNKDNYCTLKKKSKSCFFSLKMKNETVFHKTILLLCSEFLLVVINYVKSNTKLNTE